jgi:hypothetical protein
MPYISTFEEKYLKIMSKIRVMRKFDRLSIFPSTVSNILSSTLWVIIILIHVNACKVTTFVTFEHTKFVHELIWDYISESFFYL